MGSSLSLEERLAALEERLEANADADTAARSAALDRARTGFTADGPIKQLIAQFFMVRLVAKRQRCNVKVLK